jgi:very-short-patch-repair endonuclease
MPRADCIENHRGCKCSSRALSRSVSALAEEQHGVVARFQLLGLGLSPRVIQGRLERAHLHSVYRGVYAVGHRRLTLEGRWMAAVLAGGDGTVLSHRSAGQLWRVVPRSSAWPEVTRPRRFRPRPGLVAHQVQVPEDEMTIVDGIPVTGISRTVLDLAGRSSPSQVERMLNEAQILGLTDVISIPSLLARYPRRAGSAVVRQVFRRNATARGVTRKELERRFRLLLASTDLPEPRRNAHIAVRGRFFEVDCLWRAQRLVVELDGRAVHGTELAFERDREKDRLLVADGWRVARITWLQLRDEGSAVVADLRAMLEMD